MPDSEMQTWVVESFEKLDRWRSRMAQSPPVSEPGSAFEDDDMVWPYMPLSVVVWNRLVSAVDSLQALRVLIEAKSFHATATFSLTRTAILSASTAVWATCDDAGTRQARGAYLADESYRQETTFLREVFGASFVYSENVLLRLVILKARRRGIRFLDLAKAGSKSDVDIVRWAANEIQPGLPMWATQARAQYRTSSSDAHALGWSMPVRGIVTRDVAHNGLYVMQSAGDPETTADHYYVPFRTLEVAWQRFDRLSGREVDRGLAGSS